MNKITFIINSYTKGIHFKNAVKLFLLTIFISSTSKSIAQEFPSAFTVFDEILFYDGYAETVNEPVPEGILRLSNSCYTRKITTEELSAFGNTLNMNVTIKAACDNYDRIGSVNLAFVPKDQDTYTYNEVERIELGRYITPFMDKNQNPDEVPYNFSIDNVSQIFKNETLLENYDMWVELELFGVPYAANTEIAGCDGRNDVFYGTLEFVTDLDTSVSYSNNFLKPLSFKYRLRDYTLDGTDVLNETVKTITFTLTENVPNAKLHLITSNHGANAGGEEYIRRWHYIYFDEELVLNYKPGGQSCEPFREYNTQANGIYGWTPRTDAEWASFSNWCPGDKIPIRIIDLGDLEAGEHSFKIDVPEAVFANDQGEFPMSVYLQGYNAQALNIASLEKNNFTITPNPATNTVSINADLVINKVTITSLTGQKVLESNSNNIDVTMLASGMYIVKVQFNNNQTAVSKLLKK